MKTKNLILLRDYLIALPDKYQGFDMKHFNIDIADNNLNGNHCGTAACMAGHMVYVDGIPKPKGDDKWNWVSYASRVSGLDEVLHFSKFNFLFSETWESCDNTTKGAAFRINYLIDNPNADYGICYESFCEEHKLGIFA